MCAGMVVKMITRMAGPGGINPPGSVITIDDNRATELISGGYAVALDEPKIVEQPKEPEPVEVKPAGKKKKKK
jgi:hypothetical protein